MAVVDVAFGLDGFKVTRRDRFAVSGFDRDRFDPVKGVLEDEVRLAFGEGENELMREEGVGGRGTEIEEKGGPVRHHAVDFGGPFLTPLDEGCAIGSVIVSAVFDADVVGRGGYHEVDGGGGHGLHSGEAVLVVKVDHGGRFVGNWGFFKHSFEKSD